MDVPVIFSGPMVRAIKRGNKTQTRRLAWTEIKKHRSAREGDKLEYESENGVGTVTRHLQPSTWTKRKPGDRLWVRENIRLCSQGPQDGQVGLSYGADGDMADVHSFILPGHKLKRIGITPCIHMPRAVSRLTLPLTAVKIERLQDISEADAKAEGTILEEEINGRRVWHASHRAAFAALWMSIHGSASWDENPEVVALTFTTHHHNINRSDP